MKVFVLHYSKLIERKAHVLNELIRHNITDYEFIERFDKHELTELEKADFTPTYATNIMSLFLKHIHAYRLISEHHKHALIFEDDVILHSNFGKKFYAYMTQLPETYDALYIGDGCSLHIPLYMQTKSKNIYIKCLEATSWGGLGSSRCTDSYLISNACAKKLLEFWDNKTEPVSGPIDFWLNQAGVAKKLEVYWAEPTIVTQGSQTHKFARTL